MHPAFYVLFIFITIIVLGIIWGKKIRDSKEKVYLDFANKHKLDIHTENVRTERIHMTGNIDGKAFELKEEAVNFDDPPTIWTFLRFSDSPFDFDFEISCDNIMMKLAKNIANYKDVIIGNEELDKKYIFNATDADKMKRQFDSMDQIQLLEIYDDFRGLIENNAAGKEFSYAYQGRVNDQYSIEQVERVLAFMRQQMRK